MITTFQARLQMKHDKLARKFIDNSLRLQSSPTDCIRIRRIQEKHGDKITSIIEEADIIPIVFPPWKDVPYRRLGKTIEDKYELISLVNAADNKEAEKYQIYAPYKSILLPGDLLIRVMVDEEVAMPIVICLEIIEQLGTFGGEMLIQSKYNTSLYNDKLEDKVVEIVVEMAKRRLELKF